MNEQTTIPVLEAPKQILLPPSHELEEERIERLRKDVVMPQLPQLKLPQD